MSNSNATFEVVKSVIKEILPKATDEQILPTNSLKDIGANSVDRMEIVTFSMEELNIKLPLIKFANVTNIGELVEVLASVETA